MTVLADWLGGHRIDVTRRAGWLVGEPGAPAWSADVFQPSGASPKTRQLDVRVALPDGRLLIESCGAWGETPEAASRQLFDKFVTAAFHVLLSAFYGHDPGPQAEVEALSIGGVPWQLHVGPLLAVNAPPEGLAPFPELLDAVRDAFAERVPVARPHWLRIYWGRVDDQPATLEVLLDNGSWPAAAERLARLRWPAARGFTSRRLFMVMTPPRETFAPFLPERESVEVGLARLLAAAAEDPQASDVTLFQELTAANVAPDVADRLVVFAPIAFGEAVLTSVRHSGEYHVMTGDRAGPARRLADEPTYLAAKAIAPQSLAPGLREAYRALASRSAAFAAVRGLRERGASGDDAVLTAPVVRLARFSAPGRSA